MMTKHIKGDDDMTYYTSTAKSHTQNTNLELGPVVLYLKGMICYLVIYIPIKFVGKRETLHW